MSSLFESLKAANIPTDHHESDLYFKESLESLAILDLWPQEKSTARRFYSQVEREMWIEVPFAFVPFWDAKPRLKKDFEEKA